MVVTYLLSGRRGENSALLDDKIMNSSSRRFTHRELTLVLYKAAELQEVTWWLRSVRLMLRLPRRRASVRLMLRLPRRRATSYDLPEIKAIAAEMGIEARFIEEAVALVRDDLKWEAT